MFFYNVFHHNVLYFIHTRHGPRTKKNTAYFNQLYCLIHTISITTQLVPHTRELQSKKNIPDLIEKINGPKRPNKKSESNSRLEVRSRKHDNTDNIVTGNLWYSR